MYIIYITLEDIDINNALVPNMIFSGGNTLFVTLHIMLPQMIAYMKSYDSETKWMYFFIQDDDF